MVGLQIKILKCLKNNTLLYTDVLNQFVKTNENVEDVEDMIYCLVNEGLIKSSNPSNFKQSSLSLTPTGTLSVLYDIEEIEKTKKINHRYWITTSIAIIGLVKAFYPEIFKILSLIFHR